MRSFIAILCGTFTLVALGLTMDYLLMYAYPNVYGADGSTQDVKVLLITVAFGVLNHAFGAYVTAVVARRAEIRHALVLGCTLLLLAVPAMISRWHHAPAWYHVFLLASVLPSTYLGGWLRASHKGANT